MAKEIKTVKTSTALEASTIRAFQSFGWTLLNNQEVYAKDSHLERRGSGLYSITETTHYIKLTFERDPKTLKNYAQLRRLEDEYYAIKAPGKKPQPLAKPYMVLCVLVLAFICCIGGLAKAVEPFIACGILAAGLFYWQKLVRDKLKKWEEENRAFWAAREKVLLKTDQFLE